jgi:tetratricopeptide (TPR) repeat protein
MRRRFYIGLFLIVATLLVFGQVRNHDFTNWDDPLYVTENPHVQAGLSPKNLVWAFTTTHASNWHPLTWLSLMLDFELYGLNPGGYHLTNLLLHLANTLLLFLVLRRMTGALWRSGFVAALFALHPLHVESVVWVSERKDVLSTFFWMLTLWGYGRYVQRPGIKRYLLTFLTFACVMLLLDYWPLGRFQYGQVGGAVDPNHHESMNSSRRRLPALFLLWEKIPFFILAAICSVVTFLAQLNVGAVASLTGLPVKMRLANSLVSYVKYMGKMIWPQNLAALYPHPGYGLPMWQAVGAGLLLLSISIVTILAVRRYPYLIVGWLWYLGSLVPVIGLVQVGEQALADRYTYVPLIGLFIIIAWGVYDLAKKIPYSRVALATLGAALLLGLMTLTWLQVSYWKNSISLFTHTLNVTSGNYVIHNNLGKALARQGRLDEAIGHYAKALKISPSYPTAHYNLGNALANQGKTDEAINQYLEALKIKPNHVQAHYNLGIVLEGQGRLAQAFDHYVEALQINPDYVDAHNNLGVLLARQGRLDEAIGHYAKALKISPSYPTAHYNLGNALADQGKTDEAINQYLEVLKIKPNHAQAHYNLGMVLEGQGRLAQAFDHYVEALQINPDYVDAHNNLGVLLARQGRLDEARGHFRQALRIKPEDAEAQNNLGVLFVRQGKLDEAIAHYQRVLQLKPSLVEVHNNLGVVLTRQGRFDEAISHFHQALQLKPDYLQARNNLENVLQEKAGTKSLNP